MRLGKSFFARDATSVAKELLGKILVYESPSGERRLKIVETESYPLHDPSSHAARGKTLRNAVMFDQPGKAYIYFIYGKYYCLNVVTGNDGEGEAVLIRAGEPLKGINLPTNGPAKLVQAMGITFTMNGMKMTEPPLYFEEGEKVLPENIVTTTRIGIKKAVNEPLRFYIKNSNYVSKVVI